MQIISCNSAVVADFDIVAVGTVSRGGGHGPVPRCANRRAMRRCVVDSKVWFIDFVNRVQTPVTEIR